MHNPATYAPGHPATDTGRQAIAQLRALLQAKFQRTPATRATGGAAVKSARENFLRKTK